MNEGVQLMLKRMDSHPEEFAEEYDIYHDSSNRWTPIMNQVKARLGLHGELANHSALPFLSDDEVSVVYDKWVSIQGPMFTNRVMRNILLEDASEDEGQYNGMPVVARSYTASPAKVVRSKK